MQFGSQLLLGAAHAAYAAAITVMHCECVHEHVLLAMTR